MLYCASMQLSRILKKSSIVYVMLSELLNKLQQYERVVWFVQASGPCVCDILCLPAACVVCVET